MRDEGRAVRIEASSPGEGEEAAYIIQGRGGEDRGEEGREMRKQG